MELLALLVCPETHQDVVLGTSEEIGIINEAIAAGNLKNVGGTTLDQPVQGLLIRQDRAIAYPIRDGIPVMLIPEGLLVAKLKLGGLSPSLHHG